MVALQKILVVDDGHRDADRALSAELAELGYASVTTSLEASEEVLAMIPAPAAIVLQMPARPGAPDPERADRASFVALAERLRASAHRGVPVIVLDGGAAGGAPIDLQSRIGARVLNEPEL